MKISWTSVAIGLAFIGGLAFAGRSRGAQSVESGPGSVGLTPGGATQIEPGPGFTVKVLMAAGQRYRPQFMIPRGETVWLGETGLAGGGGRILEVALDGAVKMLVGAGKLGPLGGIDLAPQDFGDYGGYIFSTARNASPAGAETVQRIDVAKQSSELFCSLPAARNVDGTASFVGEARFGPSSTQFANTFFAAMPRSAIIAAAYPDGTCVRFADLSKFGAPFGISFSADGSSMLASVGSSAAASSAPNGMIVRIDSEGAVSPKPVATGLMHPGGLDLAPAGFGAYTAEIFVVDQGDAAQGARPGAGKIYRIDSSGKLTLVASGFDHPVGLRFVGEHLWVTSGSSGREPNGCVLEIDAK